MKRWYLIANQTQATIYQDIKPGKLKLIERLENPAARTYTNRLVSDRPGRVSSSAGRSIRHSLDRGRDFKRDAAETFARKISRLLSGWVREADVDEVVICAESRFLGTIRGTLAQSLQKKIVLEIAKELRGRSDAAIRSSLMKSLEAAQS